MTVIEWLWAVGAGFYIGVRYAHWDIRRTLPNQIGDAVIKTISESILDLSDPTILAGISRGVVNLRFSKSKDGRLTLKPESVISAERPLPGGGILMQGEDGRLSVRPAKAEEDA